MYKLSTIYLKLNNNYIVIMHIIQIICSLHLDIIINKMDSSMNKNPLSICCKILKFNLSL